MKKLLAVFIAFYLCVPLPVHAQQDTVEISMQTFIERGLENSSQMEYEKQQVNLAKNKIEQAQSNRYLPEFRLSTQHGAVPGVESNTNLPKDEYYLDPNLENDWNNWAVFTRAEVRAVQPLFTWGALKNAVKAARSAAKAARQRFQKQQADLRLRLFDLYQSYLLTRELLTLLEEAESQIAKIEKQIEQRQNEKDATIDQSDVYKFKVYKDQFAIRAAEVRKNTAMIQRIWNYVLQASENTVYVPNSYFIDPVPEKLKDVGYYRSNAVSKRSEINAVEAGIEAAKYGLEATKQRNYPSLFLGLTGSYANTPNRPRQDNPFIINNSNYANGTFGLGIRQNLDFLSIKADVEKSRIQYRRAKDLKEAAVDGIVLEINLAYKDASLSKTKVTKTDEALVTSKKWLRQEQLNYDLGTDETETKDLIDAMKKELELKVQLNRETFEFNKNMAELHRKAGLPIMKIMNSE